MNVLDCVKSGIFYLDGGTGSYLQAQGLQPGELPELWNLEQPDAVVGLGKAYYEAGSHMICTNTFGANSLKFDGCDGRPTVDQVVFAAVSCAKQAREIAVAGQKNRFIALDVGPLGRMLEPLGDLPFEDAVSIFAETVRAGAAAGVDCIMIETMNDAYETKAAVLAAKENCDLPVFVSNVYDETGKLMTGATPEVMAALLEALRVDAIGANCSLGPAQMLNILPRLAASTNLPIIMKPNAGMPRSENGKTVYDVNVEQFAGIMKNMVSGGACILGGCCGTTPEYIEALVSETSGMQPVKREVHHQTVITSYAQLVQFGDAPVLIGERINPTGKKRFKQALRDHDIGYVLNEAVAQEEKGVHALDVNVGLPEINEVETLTTCVREIQAVTALPLQIDTSNAAAMECALRIYNGKPMINSVSGKQESMDEIFPLAAKYGGVVVCLTLDEQGIPETAEGRLAVAEKIVEEAAKYGISKDNLIFDPLALTISSDNNAALVTLDAVRLIRERLNGKCSLGISNVSFGLPNRDFVTSAFFLMALERGLDAAIMNPFSVEMQKAYRSYMALTGRDADCVEYIGFASNTSSEVVVQGGAPVVSEFTDGLENAIIKGLRGDAAKLAEAALAGRDPLLVINEQIIPALDEVGRGFEEKRLFLPQLLMSAEAAKAAFEQVRKAIPEAETKGPALIIATVKGDIHDIGKNIVKVLLENYGFSVIDLGKDVAPEKIVAVAQEREIKLICLSALMTTTVPAMEETIRQLHSAKPDCKVVVGGAVLTQEYADMIGADQYAQTAMDTVRYAELVLN
ncbi:MAG: homocysteine S-methyltransferase family protein [Oscillospiraceae bacterium]|nr:homocysteine S-methyltransferase family protein [Oscillospiraceae bacterium]